MPTRVRVELKTANARVVTSALLNTGFTTSELDVLLPKKLAERLGLWPPPEDAYLETLDTPAGEVLSYVVPRSVEVAVLAGSERSKTITCNAIVSMLEKELLLSDSVIEELGIEILSPRTGIWRFRDKPQEVSVEPEHWE